MNRQAILSRLSKLVFGGPLGRMSADRMATGNLAAEAEAVAELAPAVRDAVLAIGFGPGIGVEFAARRVTEGWVGGIDPSAVMVKRAAEHNRAAVTAGRVTLKRSDTRAIPFPDASFDGAISVNTIQFWYPMVDSATEVARVLKPGARLVTFTHDWAIGKVAPAGMDEWLADTRQTLELTGFTDVRHWRGEAEDGHSIALAATKEPDRALHTDRGSSGASPAG